jgi:hypothetical protein
MYLFLPSLVRSIWWQRCQCCALPGLALQDLYGKRLNYVAFKRAVQALDKWYSDRGVLGQVGGYHVLPSQRPAGTGRDLQGWTLLLHQQQYLAGNDALQLAATLI